MTSLGGIQSNMPSFFQSGVDIDLLKSIAVGLSTLISNDSNIFTKLFSCSFALSIESCVLGP